MPKRPAAKLTAKERERFFVNLYVEAGAVEKKLAYCERRAALKPGDGKNILARKAVQQEIYARMEPVRMEQMRQSTITEATAAAKAAMQEELKNKVDTVQRLTISPEVLEHELMSMVVGLNMHVWPKEKLDAIKAAFIVQGTLEANNTRRITPPENPNSENGSTGLYTSLFNRLALAPPKTDVEPPAVQEGVYDLIPQAQPAAPPPGSSIPVSGEAIDEPATPVKSSSRIITVEVG